MSRMVSTIFPAARTLIYVIIDECDCHDVINMHIYNTINDIQ